MPFRTDRLTLLRKSRNLNQQELADQLGLSRSQVQRYENGTAIPRDDALIAMAQFFNTTTDYLLGLSNIPHPDAEPEPHVTADERELLMLFRAGTEPERQRALRVLRALQDEPHGEESP